MTPTGTTLLALTLVVAGGLLAPACNKNAPAKQTAKPKGKPYAIKIDGPPAGGANKDFTATVRVEPRGIYKINLEYPTRLQVKGPEAASPREVKLTAKEATKIDKSVILFNPKFRIGTAGSHAFKGAIRFSVCTPKQCELKNEKVKWVTKVTE